ncbi:nitric oxide synthase oxygenase [Deinococcus pimensis]|uniref:nitric oxide synthase oxygenase n=1 Tax=Deinococcus pimensis TaxID=309888 RepID=UPI0004B23379|nr:nitric oxide synthase oxygenase [Deinococcus pimensis]
MTAAPPKPRPDSFEEARDFLSRTYRELGWRGLRERLAAVRRELETGGTWTLTTDELTHGARMAWRHSTRCVGRSYWPSLEVRDLRHVHAPEEVFAHLVEHLRRAFHGGHVRSVMSVLAPGVRVLNDQLIRYAGYRRADGTVLGDARNADLTDRLLALGWRGGPGTRFDVLPVAIESRGETRLFELPGDAVREVPLTHPDLPWFGELGLRWHALPVISDLELHIGGQRFTCAPFGGWYLQTEIAARNLADADRYDALPEIGRRMGLDTSRERTLWRDRALLELNVAVLHSFDAAGVRVADHHSVTRHFVRFEERERRAGREVHGRWSWLVPPLSPALTPVYHRRYEDVELSPNFHAPRRPEAEPARCPFGHGARAAGVSAPGASPDPRASAGNAATRAG